MAKQRPTSRLNINSRLQTSARKWQSEEPSVLPELFRDERPRKRADLTL